MSNKRNTIQQQVIFSAVKELDIHATAEQVFEYVVKQHPSISKATVYRNLSQMAQSGDLVNIGSFYGSTHYDHKCHPHYHFVCENCERIFDVEGDFSDICGRIGNTDGFDIANHNISFSGLCWGCKTEH